MEPEQTKNPAPKMLTLIIDKANAERLENLLREKQVRFHFMWSGMGTASSEILKAFGLSGTEKTICICLASAVKARGVMRAVAERLELTRPGNGIAFIIPISGISTSISKVFAQELQQFKERLADWMDTEADTMKEEARFELIAAVVNQGYSEKVMDAARSVGARGGTIINARRSGLADAVKFFGVTLQEEKEIVTILVHRPQKKELMQLISKTCGAGTDAHGIVVSLPVESCSGLPEQAQSV